MFSRKFLTIIALAVLIATLLLGGSSTVIAQGGGNGNGNGVGNGNGNGNGPPPKK